MKFIEKIKLKRQIKEVNIYFEKKGYNRLSSVEYLNHLDKFILSHPKNPYAYLLKGKKTEIAKYFDKAIKIYPEYFEAYLLRGKLLKKRNIVRKPMMIIILLYFTNVIEGQAAVFPGIVAIVLLFTSFTRFCPCYVKLNVYTSDKQK